MGAGTDADIAAWQEHAGIEPAKGRRLDLLERMSDTAFELIKIVELEKSGIRDGNGCWHGSDPLSVAREIAALYDAWRATWKTDASPPSPDDLWPKSSGIMRGAPMRDWELRRKP
jgi:hypothetical protein